jgi:very-short-patch-repair endonuclease
MSRRPSPPPFRKGNAVCRLQDGKPRAVPLGEAEIARIAAQATGDSAAAIIAARQHRVVSRRQLRAVKLSDEMIDGRLDRDVVHRLYRGVYLWGSLPAPTLSLAAAAVIACRGAILSHFTAAWLWAFWREPAGVIDLTMPSFRKDRRGLRFHQSLLQPHEIDVLNALPLTSPARTVVDVASQIELTAIPQLVDDALMYGATTRSAILDATQRNTRGVHEIRKALYVPEDFERAKSRAERQLLKAIREAGLPIPKSNYEVDGREYDLVWPELRLIVEFDSWLYHHTPGRFHNDRIKSNAAQLAGYRILRYTEDTLTEVIAELRGTLVT